LNRIGVSGFSIPATKERGMPVSEQPLVERVARVLAGAAHSSNAEGCDPSAGDKVDLVWREHVNEALAVLHTMREADETMARRGDPEMWAQMVEAAIAEWEQGRD
jgi:predicted dienelactone hydrolase